MSNRCYVVRYIHSVKSDGKFDLTDHIMGIFNSMDEAFDVAGNYFYVEWPDATDYMLIQDFPFGEKIDKFWGEEGHLYRITEKGLEKMPWNWSDEMDDEVYAISARYDNLYKND